MRTIHHLLVAGASVLAATTDLPCQTWLPGGLAGAGNGSQTSNWRGSRRHQLIFSPAAVPARSGPIQALVLRSDDVSPAIGPVLLDVVAVISSQGVPSIENVDPTSYTNNLGIDAIVAVPLTRVTFPAGTGMTVALPLVTPFAYQNGNPLLIQIDFLPVAQPGIDNPFWMLDTHSLPQTFWGLTDTTTGSGCPAAGQWTVTSDPIEDRFLYRWGTAVLAGSPMGFLLLGTNNQTFGTLPLPLSLAAIGAPGCMLRTSIESDFGAPMALGGGFSWYLASVPIPRDPRFLGADVHAQFLVLDPTANAAGLRLSELRSEHLAVAPAPILTMHLYGPGPSGPTVPELVVRNHSLVLGLQ